MSETVTATINDNIRLPGPTESPDLESVYVHDLTRAEDERAKTLKKLLRQGHGAVAPLRNPALLLHSHLPHVSRKTDAVLTVYKLLTYTVAFVDIFDEEMQRSNGNWKKVVEKYLLSGNEPLVNGILGGLAHPAIHLAYAYEFAMPEVASQALSLACTEYPNFHKLLDREPSKKSTYQTSSLAKVLMHVKQDARFDGVVKSPGTVNYDLVLRDAYDATVENWNAWQVGDAARAMEHICDVSVLVAIGSAYLDSGKFDFFHAHILTAAHAFRVLLPNFPQDRHHSLLRQYGLFTILIYVLQLRLEVNAEHIESFDLAGRNWYWVTKSALKHKWALDDHFFKAVRGIKSFQDMYGEKDGFYLKAAVKLVSEFNGWEGFGEGVMGFHPGTDGFIPE